MFDDADADVVELLERVVDNSFNDEHDSDVVIELNAVPRFELIISILCGLLQFGKRRFNRI